MKTLKIAIASMMVSALAWGAPPATQPAGLPAGHPDISQMKGAPKPAAPAGQLPAGHPEIGGMKGAPGAPAGQMPGGQVPAGHPDIQQLMEQAKQKGMPAGHPALPGMPGAPAAAGPTSQPASGTLFIEAIQGTVGGPSVAGDPVTIELYHRGKIIGKIEKKLDADGKLTVADLPMNVEYEPVVRIKHAGVDFVAPAGAMGMGHPAGQKVKQRVFEVSEQQPEWRVKIRHLMLTPYSDAVKVMEVLNLENPTDRAWPGKVGSDGKKETFAIQLPKGATAVQVFTGFDECCRMDGERVINTLPLMPEVSQYQLQYTVPAINGKVDLSLLAIANTDRTTVFIPEDGSTVTATGLEAMPPRTTERGGKTRFFKSQSNKAGDVMTLSITNLPPGAKADAHNHGPECEHSQDAHNHGVAGNGQAVEVAGMSGPGKIYAGTAMAVVLFVGIAFLFKPTAKKS